MLHHDIPSIIVVFITWMHIWVRNRQKLNKNNAVFFFCDMFLDNCLVLKKKRKKKSEAREGLHVKVKGAVIITAVWQSIDPLTCFLGFLHQIMIPSFNYIYILYIYTYILYYTHTHTQAQAKYKMYYTEPTMFYTN